MQQLSINYIALFFPILPVLKLIFINYYVVFCCCFSHSPRLYETIIGEQGMNCLKRGQNQKKLNKISNLKVSLFLI